MEWGDGIEGSGRGALIPSRRRRRRGGPGRPAPVATRSHEQERGEEPGMVGWPRGPAGPRPSEGGGDLFYFVVWVLFFYCLFFALFSFNF